MRIEKERCAITQDKRRDGELCKRVCARNVSFVTQAKAWVFRSFRRFIVESEYEKFQLKATHKTALWNELALLKFLVLWHNWLYCRLFAEISQFPSHSMWSYVQLWAHIWIFAFICELLFATTDSKIEYMRWRFLLLIDFLLVLANSTMGMDLISISKKTILSSDQSAFIKVLLNMSTYTLLDWIIETF